MTLLDPTRAAYRVLATHGFYAPNDTLYGEGDELYYDGEPNLELEPLTPAAQERMQIFLKKLDERTQEVARLTGKPFKEYPKSEDGMYEMARAVEIASRPVMSHHAKDRPASGHAETIDDMPIPEMTPKRGRGRPSKILSVS